MGLMAVIGGVSCRRCAWCCCWTGRGTRWTRTTRHGTTGTRRRQGLRSRSGLRGIGRSSSRCTSCRRKAMGAGGAYKAGTISSLGVSWGMAIFWAGIGSPVKRFWRWLVLTWATSPATSDGLGVGQSWPLLSLSSGGPSAEAAARTRRARAHMNGRPRRPHA